MLEAVLQSVSNVLILVIIAAVGYRVSAQGLADAAGRKLVSKIVNLSIPFFLFYSMTSKFTHDQLLDLLRLAFIPFVVMGANYAVSLLMVKAGWVKEDVKGVFTACFSGASTLFVGVPMTMALFGDAGIPYLLVYFIANVLFIWTLGLYHVQLDGVAKTGAAAPTFFSARSLKMIFSLPLIGFLSAVVCILLSVPVPSLVTGVTKMFGAIATPLAIVFIGMTIQKVGFGKMRHLSKDVWLVLLGGYVIRPLLVYLFSMPFDMDPVMRKVFVLAASLPASAVIAVLAKQYGADEEYASETIGASTIALIFWLPVILVAVHYA